MDRNKKKEIKRDGDGSQGIAKNELLLRLTARLLTGDNRRSRKRHQKIMNLKPSLNLKKLCYTNYSFIHHSIAKIVSACNFLLLSTRGSEKIEHLLRLNLALHF